MFGVVNVVPDLQPCAIKTLKLDVSWSQFGSILLFALRLCRFLIVFIQIKRNRRKHPCGTSYCSISSVFSFIVLKSSEFFIYEPEWKLIIQLKYGVPQGGAVFIIIINIIILMRYTERCFLIKVLLKALIHQFGLNPVFEQLCFA